ncbi:unnamed protein product [Vicia faba]|uniref:BED-type domain-containing protein n=1 Tax=Vicia faba TaxID=3906 RepID=A0AAV0YIG8_VICFA|nr:unnamed protein product [Vicia faba]
MDQVNTTPEPEGASNPTQESTCPTQEVSSNPNPTPKPDIGQQEEIDTILEPASKKLRSNVWQEFKKMKVNGKDKAECIWCKKQLSGTSKNGTNHLKGHLLSCIQKKIKTRNHDKGQPFLLPTISEGKQELGIGTYDPEHSQILRFIYVPAPHTSERLAEALIKLRDAQPTAPSIGTTAIIDDEAEFDAYVETISIAEDSSSSVKSWLWAAENNGIFRVAEEIATVLNEMESDDEVELMEGCLGYHFED